MQHYDAMPDPDVQRIISDIESETGDSLAMAIPAITLDDDPEEKIYILLLTTYDIDTSRDWSISKGRQNTYDYLKTMIMGEAIDPNLSFIISCDQDENQFKPNIIPKSKPITVFRFMKVMFEDHKVLDDGVGFDINEFDPSEQVGDKTILEDIL